MVLICIIILQKSGVFYETKQKKISVFVIKINKNNELCNSRPCINCLNMMKNLNIYKVYYSTGDINNPIICEKIKNMYSIQMSNMTKYMAELDGKKTLSDELFFCQILLDIFPKKIKKYNFECFFNYNLKLTISSLRFHIYHNNIMIKNKHDKIIISSYIY
jgi:hypothetical protein